jgi:hypothetical protein
MRSEDETTVDQLRQNLARRRCLPASRLRQSSVRRRRPFRNRVALNGCRAFLCAASLEPGEQLSTDPDAAPSQKVPDQPAAPPRKSTVHLIERAIERLIRAGGRRSEAEADHLLEGIAVVVYDPDTATIHPDIPSPGPS